MIRRAVILLVLVLQPGCGGSGGEACDPTVVDCAEGGVCLFDRVSAEYACVDACDPLDADACSARYTCEPISDQEDRMACVEEALLKGMVFDLISEAPIANALVMASNAATAEATNIVKTDANGAWAIPIHVARNSHGDPATGDIYTLFAAAQDHVPYPSIMRPVVPVTVTQFDPESDDDPTSVWEFASALTDIGLLPVKTADQGRPSISGSLPAAAGGALVVAECVVAPCPYSYTDHAGQFTIFNVATGNYTIAAYKKGLFVEPKPVAVAATDLTGVSLEASTFQGGTITGSVSIVNAPGGSVTSVVLVPESTFHEALITGVVGPGLRAPEPPAVPNVGGAWTITGVPAGDYVVLAAFENDGLIRDPDPTISGTQIVHFTFSAAAPTADIDAFKVTEALEIVSPGASEPEAIEQGTPTFRWKDDSSEDEYVLKVYDMYGDLVWEHSMEGVSTGAEVSLMYTGTQALVPGMYYQWKVTSLKKDAPISTTEDLLGVFFIE